MTAFAYVNGAYLPLSRASVSITDRGFQFADSIYEVWAVRGGRLFDVEAHLARLDRSLRELRIPPPMPATALMAVVREVVRRNRVRNGLAYLQISRGAAPRDHAFPPAGTKATLVVTAKTLDQRAMDARIADGVKIMTLPETRWARCDIKSTALLPNVLARQAAREAGAFEAWFVRADGVVMEGASSNAWIVDAAGVLRTAPLSDNILHGVTRAAIAAAARSLGTPLEERAFALQEAYAAREAFLTSATGPVVPVVEIDGRPISARKPGPITAALRDAYLGASAAMS